MTRPGDELFRTHPADAIVAPSGWFRLPSGLEVVMEPLVDATCGLYARLSQPDAEDAWRVASLTLDATVAAAESGQCMSARSEGCDVGGAAVKAAQATAAVASFVRVLEAGK